MHYTGKVLFGYIGVGPVIVLDGKLIFLAYGY
jgi:hypothetical protein